MSTENLGSRKHKSVIATKHIDIIQIYLVNRMALQYLEKYQQIKKNPNNKH